MVRRGQLRLPEMQRRYVWPATRVRDLLDSLYRGYPSGTILVWETDQEAPTRDLAVNQERNVFATQRLLLDGQQRVTSLSAVLNGQPVTVRNKKKPVEILFNLNHPDGAPIEMSEVEDDQDSPIMDFDEEDAEEEPEDLQGRLRRRAFVVSSKALLADPLWIRVSDVFTKTDRAILKPLGDSLDDAAYDRYVGRLQRLRGIRDYPYVMHVLDRNLSYEEVAEIFVRVNSLGVKLRGSDLAMAQVTSRWQNSLKLLENFADEVDQQSWFTLEVGLLVRAMVIFATKQSRFKTVQSLPVQRMQEAWAEATDAIRYAVNFLRTNASIEDESLLASPLLILAVAAFGSVHKYKVTAGEEADLLRWVLTANARGHFSRGSSESILDADLAVIFRDGSVQDLLTLLKQQFGRLHIEEQDFVGKGARSPLFSTAYLALKSRGAKDWWSGLGLSLVHQGKLHYIEYHHIFPKAVLAKAGYDKSEINEIANFAFISGRVNRSILAKEPRVYFPDIIGKRGTEALTAQCIPTDKALWEVSAYRDFLAWRRNRLCEETNAIISGSIKASA